MLHCTCARVLDLEKNTANDDDDDDDDDDDSLY